MKTLIHLNLSCNHIVSTSFLLTLTNLEHLNLS